MWHRVMLFLPCGKVRERYIVRIILRWFQKKVPAFTCSSIQPSVFDGYYTRADNGTWDYDKIAILFVDTPLSDGELQKLVDRMRRIAGKIYRKYHAPQEAIWVTVIQIKNDPMKNSRTF